MYLTPGFLRSRVTWKSCAAILGVLLLAACSPPSNPVPAPLPVPLPAPPHVPVTTPIPVPILAEDSADYFIRTLVLTTQDSLGVTVRRDSLVATERAHALVALNNGMTFSLRVRSDSGYRISTDRMPPPETVRTAYSGVDVQTALQRVHLAMRFNTDTLAPCSAFPSLISPLSASLLARYLVADSSVSIQTDTVTFSTCDAGVSRAYSVVLRSTRDLANPFESKIVGEFHADSSRALPMRLTGNLTGTASVSPNTGELPLPESLRIRLTIRLAATAELSGSRRMQSYQQEVETLFQRERR